MCLSLIVTCISVRRYFYCLSLSFSLFSFISFIWIWKCFCHLLLVYWLFAHRLGKIAAQNATIRLCVPVTFCSLSSNIVGWWQSKWRYSRIRHTDEWKKKINERIIQKQKQNENKQKNNENLYFAHTKTN